MSGGFVVVVEVAVVLVILVGGAHAKRTGTQGISRSVRVRNPVRYMTAAGTARAVEQRTDVPEAELCTEFMLNALRLRDGFSTSLFEATTGIAWTSLSAQVDEAVKRGWLEVIGNRVRPSELGFQFLNDLQLLFFDPLETV